jgi:hypothetical protein
MPGPMAKLIQPKGPQSSQQMENMANQSSANLAQQGQQGNNQMAALLDGINAKYGIDLSGKGNQPLGASPAPSSTPSTPNVALTGQKAQTPPSTNNGGFLGAAASFLPMAGGIGLTAATDALTGGAGIPADMATFGVGSAIGRGIQSWINQDILHITTPKSLLSNVGTAVKTGAINAPFGALGGAVEGGSAVADTTMKASDKTATSWLQSVASQGVGKTMLKGGMVGTASGTINAIVNQQPPQQALPSILQDGLITAATMGAFPVLKSTVSKLIGDSSSMTVADLTKNAENIIREKNAAVNSIVGDATGRIQSGESLNALNSADPSLTNNPTFYKNLQDVGNQAKDTVFGAGTSKTLDTHSVVDANGFTPEGIQNTYNNINNPNGPVAKLSQEKTALASSVNVTGSEANKAVFSPINTINEKLLSNPKVSDNTNLAQGFNLNPSDVKSIQGMDTATKYAYITRLNNGLFPSLNAKSSTLLTTLIADPTQLASVSGTDLLDLSQNLNDIAYSNITSNSPVVVARQDLAKQVGNEINSLIKSKLPDASRFNQINKEIVDLKNASNNIEPMVRQSSFGKNSNFNAAKFNNVTNKYSDQALIKQAQDLTNQQNLTVETNNFIKGIHQAAKDGPTGIRKFVLQVIGTPLGIASKLKNLVPSKIAGAFASQAPDEIGSGLDQSLGSQVTSGEQQAVNSTAGLMKTPKLIENLANSNATKALGVSAVANNVQRKNKTFNPILSGLLSNR